MPIVIDEVARLELIGHQDFYADAGGAETAERFVQSTRQTFEYLEANPGVGRPRPDLDPKRLGLRQFPVRHGFSRVLIFYTCCDGVLHVRRVLQASRNVLGVFDPEF
jgi:plasmid stabilization system protein ParE